MTYDTLRATGESGPNRGRSAEAHACFDDDELLGRDEVVRVLDLPHGEGADHPEGIAVVEPEDRRFRPRLLVVHDNPRASRLVADRRALVADVHPVPR